ncbi:MAG: hypothetical protein VX974_04090 [Pseudomonadota bacterium]|nr:hypothetical protein [Pseudomonadota bacterium]
MKTLIAATALVAAISAPAFAQSQLETLAGVSAGEYSTSQVAQIYLAADADAPAPYLAGESTATVSSKSSVNPVAEAQFELIAAQKGEDYSSGTVTVYSAAPVNAQAAAIFADIRSE